MAKECKLSDLAPTGTKCPACRKGTLDPARGRFGPLYKCTKGCGFYVESCPTGKKCQFLRNGEKCGALMVEGTKTIPNRCSDKSCPNRNPHKLVKEK
jgi:hypothetical protein